MSAVPKSVGFGSYAVGYFALKIMVNCAAATNTPNHINAQLFASIKVNFGFRILVFADAYGGWLPTIKTERIRNLPSDSRI